jgi:hypothetical protein
MTEPPRDWDKELAAIDRAIEKQGRDAPARAAPPGTVAPPPRPAEAGGPQAPRRRSVALTWFWVLLALALAVALPLWPYQRACGLQVIFFIGAAVVTAIVGVVAAVASWANHRGFAHVLSLLVLGWALAVGAGEVLPRVGYAREVRHWSCPEQPPAPVPAEPAPAPAPAPAQDAPPAQAP